MSLLLLLACEPGASGGCSVDQEAGTAAALVDGEDWTGPGATWLWQGESLQINTVGAGDWWLSLVAQTTRDGDTLAAAVDAGAFPVDVSLTDGGWATFYPPSGASYSSREGSGELVVAEVDGDTLRACFSFEAVSDGETVTVEAGTVDAALSE
ncbi:MAG: hypothetical protein ACOZNI_13950 [Myxococcota bacterium]